MRLGAGGQGWWRTSAGGQGGWRRTGAGGQGGSRARGLESKLQLMLQKGKLPKSKLIFKDFFGANLVLFWCLSNLKIVSFLVRFFFKWCF